MARICAICEKGYKKGNAVPRGIGRRVTRRTIRRQMPNLRKVRVDLSGDGNFQRIRVCASCLKKLREENKLQGNKSEVSEEQEK